MWQEVNLNSIKEGTGKKDRQISVYSLTKLGYTYLLLIVIGSATD